jgi:hypothetical protein
VPIPNPITRCTGRRSPAAGRLRLAASVALAAVSVTGVAGVVHAAAPSIAPPTLPPAASTTLPGPTALGQTASASAMISQSMTGGLGGAYGVDGTVGLTLATTTAVVAVDPDGSSTRETTIQSLNVVDAPAGADDQVGYDSLVGTTFEQSVNVNCDPVGSALGTGLTGVSRMLGQGILDAMNSMLVGFPSDPVSVGSTWTAPARVGVARTTIPVSYQCRLTAAAGDHYTVEVSYAQDVDAAMTDGELSGTASGSGTLIGSISNPLVVSGTMYQSVDGVLSGSSGATPVSADLAITLTPGGA